MSKLLDNSAARKNETETGKNEARSAAAAK